MGYNKRIYSKSGNITYKYQLFKLKMNFNNLENKKPNALKSEHLKEGVSPIMGGIYDRATIDSDSSKHFSEIEKNSDYVNFSYRANDIEKNGMYNSGDSTYVISLINNKDKYSKAYLDCTGVVVSGIDKITGENISFLSHQNPQELFEIESVRTNFKRDLTKSLDEMLARCEPNTIDAVIMGGNKNVEEIIIDEDFQRGRDNEDKILDDDFGPYRKSIKFLNFIISNKLNFSPVVITGPNDNFRTEQHTLDVYYENKGKHLSMIRPQQKQANNESFMASDIEEKF